MDIAVGADHGGYDLKAVLIRQLKSAGHRVVDMGSFSPEPCDYPIVGAKVAKAVSIRRADRGILLCKSGGGMAIVANKFPGVRAVVCETAVSARHAREHNDANVLVLGATRLGSTRARTTLKAGLDTRFGEGRHARRVRQIARIERDILRPTRRKG